MASGRILLWGLPVLLVICVACKPKPTPLMPDSTASGDPAVEAAYRKGRSLFDEGKLGLSDEAFADIIRNHPKDPLARPSQVMRARIALAFDHPARARELLSGIIGEDDPVGERAELYDGVALYQLKNAKAAIEKLRPFEGRLTDDEDNTFLYDTLWKASRDEGDVDQAILYIDRLISYQAKGDTHDAALSALEEMVEGIQSIDRLDDLARELTTGKDPWRQVVKRMASIHLDAGRFNESAELLESLEKGGGGGELPPPRFTTVVEREQFPMDDGVVGLLVPLSGRERLVGETVLKGVMLGAKEYGLEVIIRDTASDKNRVAAIVEELVKDEHVAAVIGPIDGHVASSAVASADALGVPMFVLSPKEDLPMSSTFVFREFMTNRAEVAALVAAAKSLGHRRFTVLCPDNGYGRMMRDLFKEEVARNELEYVDGGTYTGKTTVFSKLSEQLSEIAFDAVLIPDSPTKLALIAPALAAAGLWSTRVGGTPGGPGRPVQLLVPSVGYSPDLLRRAGRYLDGALFSAFFVPNEALPGATGFTERFRIEYGAEPNYLAAYGYDAAVLLSAALKSGVKIRADIRRWFLEVTAEKINADRLATPFNGFSLDGESKASPWIFQIQEKRYELIRH